VASKTQISEIERLYLPSAFGIECIALWEELPIRVFNLLTLDEYIELWISSNRLISCRFDARAGGQMIVRGALCDRFVHTIRGTIVHYSYPTCLVIHCQQTRRPDDVQRIAITVRAVGRKTKLRITHFGLRDLQDYRLAEMFWRRAIGKMASIMQSKSNAAPNPVFQPRWLTAARKVEHPWIPHSMSLEPAIYVESA